jgi:hypothetical protein
MGVRPVFEGAMRGIADDPPSDADTWAYVLDNRPPERAARRNPKLLGGPFIEGSGMVWGNT